MTSESRVFIVQQPKPKADGWTPNFESATAFGSLHFVFDAGDRAYADPGAALVKAKKRLTGFDPEKDYLLCANFGDPACWWLVVMLVTSCGHTKLRFLYWSRGQKDGVMSNENGFYIPIELDVRP